MVAPEGTIGEEQRLLTLPEAYELLQTRPGDRGPRDLTALAVFLRTSKTCLNTFSPSSAKLLSRHLRYAFVKPSSPVVLQGQVSTSLRIALEGSCDVYRNIHHSSGDSVAPSSGRSTADGMAPEGSLPGQHYSFRIPRRASWTEDLQPQALEQVVGLEHLGEHLGFVEEGDAFLEWSLLDSRHVAVDSIIAGERGVHLLTLDRASYSHLLAQKAQGPGVAAAVNSLHASLCLRPLMSPPDHRPEEDVALLAKLLHTMDAFKHLPMELCQNMAEGMIHVRAPQGAAIIEEAEEADCMYVLLSGQVQVRQRPEPENLDLDDDSATVMSGITRAPRAGSVVAGSMINPRSSVAGKSRRERPRHESAVEKNAIISIKDKEADKAGFIQHDGNYWINKFMEGVAQQIPAQETHSGSNQTVTPMAAIAAAKWKWMTFEEREKVRIRKEAEEWEKRVAEENERKEAGVFRDVLGMGAAKAVNKWRLQAVAARRAEEEAVRLMKNAKAEAIQSTQQKRELEALAADAVQPAPDAVVAETLSPGAKGEEQQEGEKEEGGDGLMEEQEGEGDDDQRPQSHARRRWQKAGMAVAFAVKMNAVVDPNRRMMDRLARKDPTKLTEFMQNELSRRADINDVLRTVSKAVMRKGAPRKISVNNSKKLYEAISHTIDRGASDRGFVGLGGDNRSLRSLRLSQGSVGSADVETMSRASSTSLGEHPELEGEDSQPMSTLPATGSQSTLTREMLRNAEVPLVGVGQDGEEGLGLMGEEDLEAYFGSVIRELQPGASFGELALLQKTAIRTASVLVPPLAESSQAAEAEGKGQFAGVELIKVTRETYDRTVNHLMSRQLQELLEYLAEVEPFKALPQQHLASLAVFMRPLALEKGAVIVSEGDVADNLYLVKSGEVRILRSYGEGEGDLQTLASMPRHKAAALKAGNDDDDPTPAKMRAMAKPHEGDGPIQFPLGQQKDNRGLKRMDSKTRAAAVGRWGGTGGLNGAGIVVHGGAEVSNMAKLAPLAVLGPGQAFGEELLGLSFSYGRGDDDFQVEKYGSTVVATSLKVELLSINSRDLRRFGQRVVSAVQHYARLRDEWRQERLEACSAVTSSAAQIAEQLASGLVAISETPEQAESPGMVLGLVSAAEMISRRQSDSDAQGVGFRRGPNWRNLPPQMALRLPPPPESGRGGLVPTFGGSAPPGQHGRVLTRIYSNPNHRIGGPPPREYSPGPSTAHAGQMSSPAFSAEMARTGLQTVDELSGGPMVGMRSQSFSTGDRTRGYPEEVPALKLPQIAKPGSSSRAPAYRLPSPAGSDTSGYSRSSSFSGNNGNGPGPASRRLSESASGSKGKLVQGRAGLSSEDRRKSDIKQQQQHISINVVGMHM